MATLGNTADPTTQGGGAVGLMVFTPVTATEDGTITAMNIYFASSAGSGNVKPLIYQDSSGAPGALLATGTPYNFSTTLAAGWRSTPISYTFTNGQVLWLGAIQDQAGITTYSRSATGTTSYFKTGQTYASPPDPVASPSADSNKTYGFYVTYTPAASSSSNPALTSASLASFLRLKGIR